MHVDRGVLAGELARQGLRQKDLAERTGLSRITISSVKHGRDCSYETGRKIAEALGLTIEALMDSEVWYKVYVKKTIRRSAKATDLGVKF